MRIQQIVCHNSLRNVNYLIIDDENKECLCIDPFDPKLIQDELRAQGLKLKAIINTHEHWDHTKGNEDLKSSEAAEVWTGEGLRSIPADRYFKDQEGFEFSKKQCVFYETPGHTMGHVSLGVLSDQGEIQDLFCGDTLFNAGVGNCHNGGNPDVLYETYRSFFKALNDDVKVYPGHDYVEHNLNFAKERDPSNTEIDQLKESLKNRATDEVPIFDMGTERKVNPFLRLDSKEIRKNLGPNISNEKEAFLALRLLRDKW
ncbi:MAG: hydroxyacylglutathione hydrolase [Bacteriovoracaceae bacterium]